MSPGSSFAAEHFVMVTPKCEWTWRSLPDPWITELVAQLSLATWCDPDRIYATGCSMGGHCSWEVVGSSPGLFAAVAPVAAYHLPQRRQRLVEALRSMPIFVVHSRHDECCRYSAEEPLWKDLAACGNPPVRKKKVTGGHGSVWAEAYDR